MWFTCRYSEHFNESNFLYLWTHSSVLVGEVSWGVLSMCSHWLYVRPCTVPTLVCSHWLHVRPCTAPTLVCSHWLHVRPCTAPTLVCPTGYTYVRVQYPHWCVPTGYTYVHVQHPHCDVAQYVVCCVVSALHLFDNEDQFPSLPTLPH